MWFRGNMLLPKEKEDLGRCMKLTGDTNSDKILKYRLGFAYRGAKAIPIEKEKALHIIENECCLDVDETDTEIVLNAYTSNDML